MKQFLKMTLAVICGFVIMFVVLLVLGTAIVGGLAASSGGPATIPESGVLWMDMSQCAITEQSTEINPMAVIQGGSATGTIGIWDAIQSIKTAATDPAVKFIYLKTDGLSVGLSQLEELRKALKDFRQSGKAVVSYIGTPSTGSIYLASVSDKIYMTAYEGSTSMFLGVSSSLIFVKDLLDKLGVNVQLIRHGKYKSAGEMFVRSTPSAENMDQNQVMINSIWSSYAREIAQSREITEEKLNELLDNLQLVFPEDYVAAGLVDELMTGDQLNKKVAALAGEEKFKDVDIIPFADYVKSKTTVNHKIRNKIAILYADGEIVEGAGSSEVAGKRFASQIADLREDSNIKAVVFRVNSPGGSVLASEQIKAEIELLKAQKPVVASYGEYAASGGYWISASCDKIFANETTLTGSIGVFSMIPEFSDVLKDVAHVNIVSVNSNEHGDMYSLMRPFDSAELAYQQVQVERIYERFVNLVADGRELTPDFVDSIAQGRVWTGSDAIKIGLVDEIGTLEDAVHYAASLASEDGSTDLSGWRIEGYPRPKSTVEQVMDLIEGNQSKAKILAGTQFESFGQVAMEWTDAMKKGNASTVFARMPFEITIR